MDKDRQRVEDALLGAVRTPDAYLTEIASHLISAGGKRLRPVFTIVASQVGNDAPASQEAILGGISCELVHLGSLYHDDVMDESTQRRGVDTVNAKWGNLQAILAGDFLLAKASEIAAGLGVEVAELLARTIGELCQGQSRATWLILRAGHSGNDGEGQRRVSIAGNSLFALWRHDAVQQVHRRRMAGRIVLIRRPRQLRFENFILASRNLRPYLCRDLMTRALGVRGWLRVGSIGLAPVPTSGALGRPAVAGTVAFAGRAGATAH